MRHNRWQAAVEWALLALVIVSTWVFAPVQV